MATETRLPPVVDSSGAPSFLAALSLFHYKLLMENKAHTFWLIIIYYSLFCTFCSISESQGAEPIITWSASTVHQEVMWWRDCIQIWACLQRTRMNVMWRRASRSASNCAGIRPATPQDFNNPLGSWFFFFNELMNQISFFKGVVVDAPSSSSMTRHVSSAAGSSSWSFACLYFEAWSSPTFLRTLVEPFSPCRPCFVRWIWKHRIHSAFSSRCGIDL